MKIGILTYHRAENYGALLQAYALKTYLKSFGHDVSFVDYWPQYHSDYFRLFPWQQFQKRRWHKKVLFIMQLILWFIPRYIRKKRLQKFMQDKLELRRKPMFTNDNCITELYDMVIYGSDQIWRKQNLNGVGFDDWYFGAENVKANKKAVYAGSMGTICTSSTDDDYVKCMMRNFDIVSVRENDLQSYLENLGVSSSLVIDPVFLLSREQWRSIEKKKDGTKAKYILFYNLLNTSESKQFAEQLSQDTNLPIREVSKRMSYHHIGKRYISTASVEQFLQLIDGAEYVVSNSFHGVAISIIFQKQFYAVGMGQRSNRVMSLLNSLCIEDRYVEDGQRLLFYEEINYKKVHDTLTNIISESLSFLNKLLECDEAIK